MKNKRTFLASLALGIFLFAMAAPIITVDSDQQLGIEKRKIKHKI
ncbi:hypothetical protein [Maribacter cobaltidurans]|nr:hypothetical protein [Maribacter cobaltidurans]